MGNCLLAAPQYSPGDRRRQNVTPAPTITKSLMFGGYKVNRGSALRPGSVLDSGRHGAGMATTPIELPAYPDVSEDSVRRISNASTFLPRVRELRELEDILERQPLFFGLADRLVEVEDELRIAESHVVEALCRDAD